MPSDQPASRRIHILREEVARKIAAGEVIDRPQSVIRELLDNAIDAGARTVEVAVEAGGTRRIRVVDDGGGMGREDLEICTLRHATSKILEDGDLYRVATLGFRGEALASIGTCSRLEIVSLPEGAAHAWRLVVEGGRSLRLEACEGRRGTTVEVADLFYNLPARRRFLKAQAAETSLCRQALLEKAIPHPAVSFRFLADGALKDFLPAAGLRERVAAAAGLEAEHLTLLEDRPGEAAPFHLRVVAGRPEIGRSDRRHLQVYVNRRRVFEYAFVQAVEHAYSEYLTGGQHPVAYVFLEVDPELADFNIHPAKREVRLRQLPEMRQRLVALLKGWLAGFGLRPGTPPPWPRAAVPGGSLFPPAPVQLPVGVRLPAGVDWKALAAQAGQPAPGGGVPAEPDEAGGVPVYRGRVFGLFLLAELGERLFIMDAHAAHERLLYEGLLARPARPQELLFPIRLETGREAAERLLRQSAFLSEALGIRIEAEVGDPGTLHITALPEELLAIPEKDLAEALAGERGTPEELREALYRLAACRLAVKDGDPLDPLAARQLVADAFRLPNARCPHGRPIWTVVQREDLLRAVGRPPGGGPPPGAAEDPDPRA